MSELPGIEVFVRAGMSSPKLTQALSMDEAEDLRRAALVTLPRAWATTKVRLR